MFGHLWSPRSGQWGVGHFVPKIKRWVKQYKKQLPPPTVKRALVHATSVLTTRDHRSSAPAGVGRWSFTCRQAGIERGAVTLGHNATQVEECVTEYGFTRLHIDFVYLTLGSAVGAVWCGRRQLGDRSAASSPPKSR